MCLLFGVIKTTPGVLGEVDLAAQHVIMEIGAIMYMVCVLLGSDHLLSYMDLPFTRSLQFPLGINAAASVCIGNELGAGNTAKAKLICKLVLVLAGTGGAPVKGNIHCDICQGKVNLFFAP